MKIAEQAHDAGKVLFVQVMEYVIYPLAMRLALTVSPLYLALENINYTP